MCIVNNIVAVVTKMTTLKESTSAYFGPSTRSRHNKASVKRNLKADSTTIASKISTKNEETKADTVKNKRAKLEIKWEPENWKLQFDNIRTMRKEKDAPVDTMGCERCTKDNYTEKVKKLFSLFLLYICFDLK